MSKNTKKTKQKNSNEESLLAEVAKLKVDNFLLSNPKELATVGPLPSTAGGNAAPVNTSNTPTAPATATATAVTPTATAPTQSINTSNSNRQSYQKNWTEDMNAEERAKIEAENAAEIARADNINSLLPAEMKRLNDSYQGNQGSMYKSNGLAKMFDLPAPMPLPVMPRLKDVPNMVTGSFGEGASNYSKQATSGPSTPRPELRNTKFDLDANTGTLGVSTIDTDNFKQDAGLDQLSKKTNLEAVKTVDNYIAQTYPTAESATGAWEVESGGNENNKKPGKADMTGSMTDALTRHVGNYLVKNHPDLLVQGMLVKGSDGNYSFANRNLPLMADKAYNIVDPNGKPMPYTESSWKQLKDKPGYRIQSNQRYNGVIEKAVSEFMEKNGLSSKGYNTSKAFYTNYDDGTKAALGDARNASKRQRHAANQMIPTRDALKWKIMYGHTLGGA